MNRGILIVRLTLICIALIVGGVSIWRYGLFSEGDGYLNFQALGMLCVVLGQVILIVIGVQKRKKDEVPIV
jgi:hypothetical protein